ncbi:hypothetical protein LUZ60_010306 [Juncus effusus]|nr:hypothetical protein LUZ60_010306 [Juncus effusus]
METFFTQPINLPLLDFLPLPLPLLSDPDPLLHSRPDPLPSQEPDHFDRLPDPVLLLILNRVHDVKALGRCCLISRRFRFLVPLVDQVHVKIDCVISDQPFSSSSSSAAAAAAAEEVRPRGGVGIISHLSRAFQAIGHLFAPSRSRIGLDSSRSGNSDSEISHHSPDEVLRNFEEVKFLKIELPGGELGLDDGVLLQWKAKFGSTLENCAIFGASRVYDDENPTNPNPDSNEPISNVVFKLRVVWAISALIAASARHYLLQSIISSNETLKRLVLTDQDQQGELIMDEKELQDFQTRPVSASCGSLRTIIPALSIKLWYVNWLEVPNGRRFEGATLMAVQPSGTADLSNEWVLDAFDDEEYKSAVKMLLEKKNYCLEMNSF